MRADEKYAVGHYDIWQTQGQRSRAYAVLQLANQILCLRRVPRTLVAICRSDRANALEILNRPASGEDETVIPFISDIDPSLRQSPLRYLIPFIPGVLEHAARNNVSEVLDVFALTSLKVLDGGNIGFCYYGAANSVIAPAASIGAVWLAAYAHWTSHLKVEEGFAARFPLTSVDAALRSQKLAHAEMSVRDAFSGVVPPPPVSAGGGKGFLSLVSEVAVLAVAYCLYHEVGHARTSQHGTPFDQEVQADNYALKFLLESSPKKVSPTLIGAVTANVFIAAQDKNRTAKSITHPPGASRLLNVLKRCASLGDSSEIWPYVYACLMPYHPVCVSNITPHNWKDAAHRRIDEVFGASAASCL